MAVIKINGAPYPSKYAEYSGLSTDDKPTDVGINSLFLALDENKVYYFDGTEWAEVGSSSNGGAVGT